MSILAPRALTNICTCCTMLLFLILCPQVHADSSVLSDHVIKEDTTWAGDVVVDGVVVVGRGATLTIAPGTTIRFRQRDTNRDGIGDSEIRVLGRLLA